MFQIFHPSSIAATLLLLALSADAQQTVLNGIDSPPGLGPITNNSVLLDGDVPLSSGLWQYHNADSHDGVDSVKSTLPYRSESRLATTVQGPATISFWWKLDSVATFDRFYFTSRSGGASFSGVQPWQQITIQVDTGIQPVEWFFERLASFSPGGIHTNASAWVDQFTVQPIPNNPSLQTAVDNAIYSLHSTDWVSHPLAEAVSGSLAKSGGIAQGGKSKMVFEVEGPAVVSFDWAITSDENYASELAFFVNNSEQGYISGNKPLARRSFDLAPGTHQLKLQFARDFTTSEDYTGAYEAFVDNLTVSTFGQSPVLAAAVDRVDGVYSDAWTRSTIVHSDGIDSATVTAPEIEKYRRLYLDLPEEPGLLTFWTKTETDANEGVLFIVVDNETVLQRSGIGDWAKTEVNLPAASSRMLQAVFYRYKNVDANSPNTRVFLDFVTFTPGANNYQPDLSIAPKRGMMRGIGLHNATGAAQMASIKSDSRRPVGEYVIRARNGSSSDMDEFTLRSIGNARHFDILLVVTVDGRKLNFGAALKTGKFTTLKLEPGEAEQHEIWIARKASSFKQNRHTLKVIARSKAAPSKVDAIKTMLNIPR